MLITEELTGSGAFAVAAKCLWYGSFFTIYVSPAERSGSSKPRSLPFNLKQPSAPKNKVFNHLTTTEVGEYMHKQFGKSFVRLFVRENNSICPRSRAGRAHNRHASFGRQRGRVEMKYGTTSLKKLEMDPEAKDKCDLIVAMLESQQVKMSANKIKGEEIVRFRVSTRRHPYVE